MNANTGSQLVKHGMLVIVLGLAVGFPYASAITEGWGAEAERAWRTAHLEGLLNGMLVLALGAATPLLRFAGAEERWFRRGALATGYGNVIAATLAAIAGERGLAPGGPLANGVVFGLFTLAIVGVLAALGIAVRAAARAREVA